MSEPHAHLPPETPKHWFCPWCSFTESVHDEAKYGESKLCDCGAGYRSIGWCFAGINVNALPLCTDDDCK